MTSKNQNSAAVICIIVCEFCERFSFCGLRTILAIYLRNELLLSENSATVAYHIFIMGCYIMPLVGGICADSVIGKYRTILYFSFIYLIGNILMCIATLSTLELSKMLFTPLGLLLIAVGGGGIKPCVAAFGGDQFYLPDQQSDVQHFFSIFYFSVNLGGFVGIVVTPILRKHISCFGNDTCYPLGFGLPAALMVLSIFIFVFGKRWYRMKNPTENVMLNFLKCALYASAKQLEAKPKKNQHWLDYGQGRYNPKLIRDMKIVFGVIFLFIPVPLFWSLFDQQGSRWTFQASHMNGNVLGIEIVPDQMQVMNPAIILILIPVFDKFFNPCLLKIRGLDNCLYRMAIGGIIAGLSFVAAGILEMVLEKTYPDLPTRGHASMFIINTLPCRVKIFNPFNGIQCINSSELSSFKNIEAHHQTVYNIVIETPEHCGSILFSKQYFQMDVTPVEDQVDTIIIGMNEKDGSISLYVTDPIDFEKSLNGRPRLRVAYVKNSNRLRNVTVLLRKSDFQDIYFVQDSLYPYLATSGYMELPQGEYQCVVQSNGVSNKADYRFNVSFGGIYSLIIRENHEHVEFIHLYSMAAPNTVSILWLIPQYLLISIAEIMFAVAGLEFAFLQAPKCMKTVTIAGWYLCVAVGSFFVIIVTQASFFRSQAYEFFLFAVLIVADMMIFMQIASNYKYVQLEADSLIHVYRGEDMPLISTDNTCYNEESDEVEVRYAEPKK